MSVEETTVTNIARLAHLEISQAQTQKYAEDLNNIFALVKSLEQFDTSAIQPMIHPLPHSQRLREDEVTEPDQREAFQKIAPATAAGLYLVPQVIE
ncbi:MAG: Asp-tRNA(Asn)/Glu-tRNA(Gln) amidotransferase subunit GatC [Gammaproteobacteria bacterium]|nr:Asp-tRNA(Asn)/Glu-tRNA(Gln) amidotransferase subunit GatC [Gammaproteobacteria bacterium]